MKSNTRCTSYSSAFKLASKVIAHVHVSLRRALTYNEFCSVLTQIVDRTHIYYIKVCKNRIEEETC